MEYKTILIIFASSIADAINEEIRAGWEFESLIPSFGSTTCNFVVLMSRPLTTKKVLF